MLADDNIGQGRETVSDPPDPKYQRAFEALQADPNNEQWLVLNSNEVVGTFQLTFIPSLTRGGAWRCQIEGVRIERNSRGHGYGKKMFKWAIARAKEKNCGLVQLTTDKKRPEALHFYLALGFEASHEGMKLKL